MATKVNAGNVKRGDLLFVDPFEIKVVEELRGRHKPPSEEAVINLAMSLLEFGQEMPVECRKIEGHKLQLTMGFTRTAAVRLIRTGFTDLNGVTHPPDPEFRLKVILIDTNDDAAFLRNIVENAHRNQTSPMDDAFNQQRLRDKYGKSDAEITRLYQYKTQTVVSRLKKLLSLETRFQDMIHEGTLSVNGAIELLDLPAEERDAALNSAINQNSGKVNATELRAQVRDRILADQSSVEDNPEVVTSSESTNDESFGDGTPAPVTVETAVVLDNKPSAKKQKNEDVTTGKPRTIREERATLQAFVDAEEVDPAVKKCCNVLIGHINGNKSDNQLLNAFYALLDAKRSQAK